MSISAYFRPNIHQNGPKILGARRMCENIFKHFDCKGYVTSVHPPTTTFQRQQIVPVFANFEISTPI
jgi:hypothetical protein